MAKAKAARAAIKPGSLLWLQGLACGALATLATPTFVLAALLLAPSFVSVLMDRSRGKPTARSVVLFGLAATLPPLASLLRAGHTLGAALDIASDAATLATAWAAQGAAWLLCEVGPLLITLVMDAASAAKAARLRVARAAYEDQWGLPPAGRDSADGA
jgi:hypothetical protein